MLGVGGDEQGGFPRRRKERGSVDGDARQSHVCDVTDDRVDALGARVHAPGHLFSYFTPVDWYNMCGFVHTSSK